MVLAHLQFPAAAGHDHTAEVGGEAEAEFLHHLYHRWVVSAALAVGEGVVSAVGEGGGFGGGGLEGGGGGGGGPGEEGPTKINFFNKFTELKL